MSKYTERKMQALADALTITPKQYPDCDHCDNGSKTASQHPTQPHQCQTGRTGKCKCGRYLSFDLGA